MELFKIGFLTVRVIDIIDISLVTFLFFKLYELLKGSLGVIWRKIREVDLGQVRRGALDTIDVGGFLAPVLLFCGLGAGVVDTTLGFRAAVDDVSGRP